MLTEPEGNYIKKAHKEVVTIVIVKHCFKGVVKNGNSFSNTRKKFRFIIQFVKNTTQKQKSMIKYSRIENFRDNELNI